MHDKQLRDMVFSLRTDLSHLFLEVSGGILRSKETQTLEDSVRTTQITNSVHFQRCIVTLQYRSKSELKNP